MPLLPREERVAPPATAKWWSDAPPAAPPGGFANGRPEAASAVQFLIRHRERPSRPGHVDGHRAADQRGDGASLGARPRAPRSSRSPSWVARSRRSPTAPATPPPTRSSTSGSIPRPPGSSCARASPSCSRRSTSRARPGLTRDWYQKLVAVDTPFTPAHPRAHGTRLREGPGQQPADVRPGDGGAASSIPAWSRPPT